MSEKQDQPIKLKQETSARDMPKISESVLRFGIAIYVFLSSISCITYALGQSATNDSAFFPTFVLPRQEIRTIEPFGIYSAVKADQQLKPDEMVLGVAVGGVSRAYPLNMISLPKRELYNEQMEGESIAITWCSKCFTAAVYDRKTSEGVLDFGIAGTLWNDNMVMYDSKTNSLWSQIKGEAMSGRMKGESLKRISSDIMSWREWKKKYPETTVAVFPRTTDDFWQKKVASNGDLMLGLISGKIARGWSFSKLREMPIINDTWKGDALLIVRVDDSGSARVYSRSFGTVMLDFRLTEDNRMVDDQSNSVWDAFTGKSLSGAFKGAQLQRIPTMTSYKKVWEVFFPDTEYF